MKRFVSLEVGCLAISLVAEPAQAHLVVTGMGPLYDGISHLVLSPEDFLPLIALAFIAGLRASTQARHVFFALPLAWLAGGVLALCNMVPPVIVLSYLTAALFLVIGGLLAANLNLSTILCTVLGAMLGIVRGMADFAKVGASVPHFFMVIGVCASVFVLSALATSVTLPLKRLWMIVAVRVFGSWTAALGLLLAGWIFRYGALVS